MVSSVPMTVYLAMLTATLFLNASHIINIAFAIPILPSAEVFGEIKPENDRQNEDV